MKIGRFDRYSDGKFYLAETMSTDSPYWRVENGQIFYIIWDVIRSVYVERKKLKMKMSEKEAIADNCGCYYQIWRIKAR